MRTQASMIAVLAGGLLTSACAGSPVLYNHFVNSRYSPTEYGVGAGRKDLETVIQGDPFGIGTAEFAAATTAILNRHQPVLQPTHFTTAPGEDASPDHRMVLLFDRPEIPVFRLCREPLPAPAAEAPVRAPDRTLHAAAAFCLHQGELTAVEGEVDGVAGVDDPAFERLLAQIVRALFPPTDPNEDDTPLFRIGALALR